MDQNCQWGVFSKIILSITVPGQHWVRLSNIDMAGLGAISLPFLCLAHASESRLDVGQASATTMGKQLLLPAVHQKLGDH
jgi:hypothetical protein